MFFFFALATDDEFLTHPIGYTIARGYGYMFSLFSCWFNFGNSLCIWRLHYRLSVFSPSHWLQVFPPSSQLTCFSASVSGYTFSRHYNWTRVFPPLAFPPSLRSLTKETVLTLRSAIVISNSFLVFDSFASRILSNFSRATACGELQFFKFIKIHYDTGDFQKLKDFCAA